MDAEIWLDLANPADIPFFAPIVEELDRRGYRTILTARDFGQTVPLARKEFGKVVVIGKWGRRLPAKGAAVARRAGALGRFGRRHRFGAALSLNSYAQILAAKSLRIPIATTMDYEGQPANHLGFRLADVVVVPEVFPDEALARFGARNVRRHPGLKEHAYLDRSPPSPDFRGRMGVGDDEVLAVMRPPPDFSAYHQYENPLFDQAVDALEGDGVVRLVMPRTAEQSAYVRERWGGGVRTPDGTLPNVDLLWAADLVVGAGGTMNREAALLGTPAYSLFAGHSPAVDEWLIERGLLTTIRDPSDLARIHPRRKSPASWPPEHAPSGPTLSAIADAVAELIDGGAARPASAAA